MTRESIHALRQLRDRGYIRGFMVHDDRCVVLLDDGHIYVDEESVRNLIARTRIWTMLGLEEASEVG